MHRQMMPDDERLEDVSFKELQDDIDHKYQNRTRITAGYEGVNDWRNRSNNHTEIRDDVGNADKHAKY